MTGTGDAPPKQAVEAAGRGLTRYVGQTKGTMSATVEQKRMLVADVVLRRAARLIPLELSSPALPITFDEIDVAAAQVINLANLDLLESVGRSNDLRGGFWRDLIRACEMLDLAERMPRLRSEYRAALQRVGMPARDPDIRSVADCICRLPVLFQSTIDRSLVDLLAISGYTAGSTTLTREALTAVLRSEPALVQAWHTHSIDKRTPSGWYLSSDDACSVVARFPDGPRLTFTDPIEACAELVLREVEELAQLTSQRSAPG